MLISNYIRLVLIDLIKRLNIFQPINILMINHYDEPIKATTLIKMHMDFVLMNYYRL